MQVDVTALSQAIAQALGVALAEVKTKPVPSPGFGPRDYGPHRRGCGKYQICPEDDLMAAGDPGMEGLWFELYTPDHREAVKMFHEGEEAKIDIAIKSCRYAVRCEKHFGYGVDIKIYEVQRKMWVKHVADLTRDDFTPPEAV